MFTLKYKNWFIHGWCGHSIHSRKPPAKPFTICSPDSVVIFPCSSLLAAKQRITKFIKLEG